MEYHEYTCPDCFDFETGGSISGLRIAYHTSPHPYRRGEPVVLLCHALTISSDAESWWPQLVGPGRPIDTDRCFVFCVNMLGSCYGSSGPASVDPETGRPYLLDFPRVTVRDIARAIIRVREHLGIGRVDLLVGCSIGGFQALELAIMEPAVYARAVFMATTERVSPWLSAIEEAQRMALEADPTFRAAASPAGGRHGLRCARAIALLSYRCDDGLNDRQAEPSVDTVFPERAGSYLRHQADKFLTEFDAYSYWYLTYAVDSVNVGRGRGGTAEALGRITAESLVVALSSDVIFPPKDMRRIAEGIPGARFEVLPTRYGHDGFIVEQPAIARLLAPFLP